MSTVRDRKGIVSSTYMSFVGVISIKGRILFNWVVIHTPYFIVDNTIQ